MKKDYRKVYTNMCMVYNENGEILVELRLKGDWPGLTFPGGHIEDGEDPLNAVKREVKEETGLTISDVEFVDEFVWCNDEKNEYDIALLYRTKNYHGKLESSPEGPVFFVKVSEVNQHPFSTDFDKVLELMLSKPSKLHF
ncbi:MAG: NUDIX domain-containing protein [Erysipelotrichaceae bacterium]|jgi:8-oxo-dGTP diphosphatase|nr:NUDIX domain-containing protein [Bacilli bacterium]NLJ32310.1 NUDIX domain-containing protein [Erysipelotrichaceae bacterium]